MLLAHTGGGRRTHRGETGALDENRPDVPQATLGFIARMPEENPLRFVRADELKIGDCLWFEDDEWAVLKVRDSADGRLVLTLRPSIGPAKDRKVAPWDQLAVAVDASGQPVPVPWKAR